MITRMITRLLSKRRRKLITYVACLAYVTSLFIQYDGLTILHSDNKQRHRRATTEERPVMHTFYESEDPSEGKVLDLWKREWAKAGFDTKVLTLEDAKMNPKFEGVQKTVDTLYIGRNRNCFNRWLAMITLGGGWYSDYDTFPTVFPMDESVYLPNDGTFTSFQGNVPALMSGSAEEWDRVLQLLIEAIPRIKGGVKSDKEAFGVIREEHNHDSDVHFYFPPLYVQRGFAYDSPRQVNCEVMSKVRSVHISHALTQQAISDGFYPMEFDENDRWEAYEKRAQAYDTFLRDWRSQCTDSDPDENDISVGAEASNSPPVPVNLPEAERPIMHTFFHSIERETEDAVLQFWREEWNNAGFNTQVLTLEDAKKHPYFTEIEKIMTPLFGNEGYNALCFYRWMAMAVAGGGWLSDHDTFPTNFPLEEAMNLPNGGKFTSFQSHVPALMSGSAVEWDRVFKLLIDAIPRIEEDMKSDMHAFYTLHKEGNDSIIFIPWDEGVQDGFLYDEPRKVNCEKMSMGRAVHVSHALTHKAVVDGLFPLEVSEDDPVGVNRRAEASKIFMDDWRNQCLAIENKNRKPIMHTFYHSRGAPFEEEVLKLWRVEWERAGWDTHVLTIEDSEKHPDYEEVEKIVTPLHGRRGYDSLCFYRWLAMAASGGGWMSDHDTFPTNFPRNEGFDLPNGGTFTSFQAHVPSLVCGSEDEWNRVTKLLIDAIPRIRGDVKSDMFALETLRQEGKSGVNFMVPKDNVQTGFVYKAAREVNCEQMAIGRAVHVAHSATHRAVNSGLYPLPIIEEDPFGDRRRAEASKVFMDDWRSQCTESQVE